MGMENWDDLRFVVALARHGTMTRAALSLGTNVATVSRRIERLTKTTGETLFAKTPDQSWKPSDYGAELVALGESIAGNLADLNQRFDGTLPDGATLRLSIDLPVLQLMFANCVDKLLVNNEEIALKLSFPARSVALGETDISVTLNRPKTGRVICQKITSLEVAPFVAAGSTGAVRGWLATDFGRVAEPAEEVLGFHFEAGPKVTVEGLNMAAQAVANHGLVALLPVEFAVAHPLLKRYEQVDAAFALDVWLTYHEPRKNDPLVRFGVDLVHSCIRERRDSARHTTISANPALQGHRLSGSPRKG